jgi:hypothetical protein|tara:strand:- start:141 stop:425 length:285 start_codon:yes stop_codon:yes gene_type:complete
MPPIREFFHAFEKDLIDADKILIIGYSFSDDHINNIIDTSLEHNEKVEIDIIDYNKNGDNKILSKKVSEKLNNIDRHKTHYYMNGFSEYLENEL